MSTCELCGSNDSLSTYELSNTANDTVVDTSILRGARKSKYKSLALFK